MLGAQLGGFRKLHMLCYVEKFLLKGVAVYTNQSAGTSRMRHSEQGKQNPCGRPGCDLC